MQFAGARPLSLRLLRLVFGAVFGVLLLVFFIRPPAGEGADRPDALCPSPANGCQRLSEAVPDGAASRVRLPHVVPLKSAAGTDGATAVTLRYRVPFQQAWSDGAADNTGIGEARHAVGLCLLRSPLISQVMLDGRVVYRDEPGVAAVRRFLRPIHVALSSDLAAGLHELVLDVRAPPGLAPGLGPVWLGGNEALRDACTDRAWQVHDRAHGIAWVMAAMGLAGLMLWWTLGERATLWFALTSLAWVAHLLVVSNPWAGLTLDAWSLLFFTSRAAFLPPMLLFALSVAGSPLERHHRWVLVAYGVGLAALWLLPPAWRDDWLIVVALASLPGVITVQCALMRSVWRAGSVSVLLMALSFAMVAIAQGVDMAVWWSDGGYGSRAWTYVAVPLLCLAFGIRLIERLIDHARRDARAAVRLSREVDAQRVRIAADYQRLQQQREQLAVLDERRRIVRDMHDGLGVHLLSASALLKSQPDLPPARVAETLDDALKELRCVLDVLSVEPSNDPDDDPVSTLLGTLRWRIAPALQANGITLKWQCDALPAHFLNQDNTRMHLLRLLQEAFSNILKHSRATSTEFRASVLAGGGVCMALRDDGQGFTPDLRPGIGLDSMRARASAMGAVMNVLTAPGEGSQVELRWPAPPV